MITYIEKKTKINKLITFLVFSTITVYILIFAMNSLFMSRLAGFVYPCIQTLKAIGSQESKPVWLTYWCIYGFTVLVDEVTNSQDINSKINKIVPLFHFFKFCVFIWLSVPPF